MSLDTWKAVDGYVDGALSIEDDVLRSCQRAAKEAGLPHIAVSAAQGKQLHLLVKALGAKRILEVGTLGGYSAIWMARALPEGGKLVTLEIDPKHADVAKANIARAGLAAKVDIHVGAAIETLPKLEGPFDFAFLDADKESNADYFSHALRMSRPGSVIIVDNVIRNGDVLKPGHSPMVDGVRRLFDLVQAEKRVSATAIQTVGDKGYDGYLMAVVN